MGGNLLDVASWRVVYVTLPLSWLGFVLSGGCCPCVVGAATSGSYGVLTLAVAVSTLQLALTQANRLGPQHIRHSWRLQWLA